MPPQRFDAVVFDFDGVLFDSMTYHAEAYRRILQREAPEAPTVEDREVFRLEGQRSQEVLHGLSEARDLGWSPDRCRDLAEEKQGIFADLATEAAPYPGALDVVREVRARGVPLGLVTGTDPRNIERFLGVDVGLFDIVVAGPDVERGKPHPDPYLTAMEALDVEPERVLVVENAPLGIESGRKAGAHVVAVTTTLDAEDLEGADEVLASLDDVLGLLGEGS